MDRTEVSFDCAAPSDWSVAADALVSVKGVGQRQSACSGVALAPNLVITKMSCLVPRRETGFDCNHESDWAPVESGNFAAWLDVPDPALTIVETAVQTGDQLKLGPPVEVLKVVSSGSVSSCADDLALVVVAQPVATAYPAVRLADNYPLDEAVVVRGMSPQGLTDLDAHVTTVTGSVGNELAPPRMLTLDVGTCGEARGGAVFSAETGALIGLIQWSTEECAGQTIALQLAPFRRLLLDTAGATLESEWISADSDTEGSADACRRR